MIVSVKKYLLLGAKEDLDRFFAEVQRKAIVEFIPASGTKALPLPIEAQNLLDALKVLRKLPVKKKYEGPTHPGYGLEVAKRILEGKAGVEKLLEEKRLLESEIVRITPFGDFSLEDIDYLEKEARLEIQFFCQKKSKKKEKTHPSSLFLVSSTPDLDYYLSISSQVEKYPGMIEMRIDRPLGELSTHLNFVSESLAQFQAELKGFAGHISLLQETLLEYLNDYHLQVAKKRVSFPIENALFAVEGWIPENKTGVLYALLQGMAIHCEPILIEKTDRIPTRMENTGIAKVGEDLVRIYDIPSFSDKDPSLPVLLSFTLFFAMIVADAGYGLLYLALALYLKYKLPHLKAQGRRMIKLMILLSSACIVWGAMTASFFGLEVNPEGKLAHFSLIENLAAQKAEYHRAQDDAVHKHWVSLFPSLKNALSGPEMFSAASREDRGVTSYEMRDTFSENILLELSLLIGVLHVGYALLRYVRRHLAGLGWVLFLIGGYLYCPYLLEATSMLQFLGLLEAQTAASVGLQLIYSGLILVFVLSLIQKKWKGLLEVTHVMQIFGDVLSYLRLYALGLAGVLMAETFNKMGVMMNASFGVVPGAFVILLGHSININLGIVEGVVHGLRLNFIEWYHYSFEGGGKLFKPLMRFHSRGD